MFDAIVFVKALVVGLSVAAPVGPIGLLTIQRTLHRGFRMGLATGIGAAVADATYGTVGALGVTWLIAAARTNGRGLWAAFGGTVLLTLANPATIVSFIAVFGVLAAGVQSSVSPMTMIAGVFLGSASWWLFLATVVSATRTRFDDVWRRRINIGSALVLAGFALWQVAIAVRLWL